MLSSLISRLKSGELSFEEFVAACVKNWVKWKSLGYPETDGNVDAMSYPSQVTLESAVRNDELTRDQADAVYDAVFAELGA